MQGFVLSADAATRYAVTMQCFAPTAKEQAAETLGKCLWAAIDLRAKHRYESLIRMTDKET